MRNAFEEGHRASHLLMEEARASGVEHELCSAEMVMAFADYYRGNLDQAEAEFGRLAFLCEVLGEQRIFLMCLYGMLRVLRHRGLMHEAYDLGHHRLLSMLPIVPTQETVLVLNVMAIVAQGCGNTDEALTHYYRALEAARLVGLPKRVVQITVNISELFYLSGNVEDAENMLTEASQMALASAEPWLISYVASMMALCKLALKKYDEAYEHVAGYVTAVENDKPSNIANRAFCLSVAAYTFAMQDQLDEAENLSDLAGGLLNQFEDRQLKPYVWWVRGHLHHRRGRIALAIESLTIALLAVGEKGYVYMRLRAIEELAEIYAGLGDWQKAFQEHQRFHALFASAQDQATRGRLQTLHIRNELKNAELARHHAQQAMEERQQLEHSLKQSLAERETVLEQSIVGIAMLTVDGRVHWANRAMVNMFGVAGTQYLGKSLEPHYPSREEYLKTGAAVFAAVTKGQSYETELRMRRQDGSIFWAYLSGKAVHPSDLSLGTVWALMDITARRQLEEDLNKSEEHYRQVVNNVTEGILVIQEAHIVFANPRVLQITGYTEAEVIGMPMLNDVHPDDKALVLDQFMRRERGEQVTHYPVRIINRKQKAILWMEVSSVIIEWEGRPATLSFMTDITERRRLEDSLKHSMAESARLQTLQFQSELNEAEGARRHAEETTKAKSMFLANMSHEIRTPMNAIIGMAHLALKSELNLKQHDYVTKIHGAGISLLGIINDILDFSKIEAGKLAIERVDFSLDNVLSHVSTITSAKAHEKGLEYLYQVPFDIPRGLVGDPLRLGQILINLINNAIKFTEHGEIHVGCQQLDVGANKVQLRFSVRDTGIGMSREEANKLFHAFSQADGSTTRKYGGTGLGLSISKGIVELMDGAIWLESEPGQGTTIYFNAWFGVCADQQSAPLLPQHMGGMRILVVDDNPAARRVLADTLSALDIEVDQAENVTTALMALRACDASRPYAVVFTDLEMPGGDGIELIAKIRKDTSLIMQPFLVLLSADGGDEIRYRADNTLADGFLTKPVNPSTLIQTLAALFGPATHHITPIRQHDVLPHFHQLTVLVTEDNDVNQQIATELLKAVGVQVEVAGNGRIALERLLAVGPTYYGLVFMDVQMPEMDGYEATEKIRADSRFAGLPIVAMTAHAMTEERDRCLASGMSDHLTKPINPSQLYRSIGRWCPLYLDTESSLAMSKNDAMTIENKPLIIDGIDVQDGLSRTLGNRAFYQEMLLRFRDDQFDAPDKIHRALQDGDRILAERLTHTLKGVSGTISATRITALAAQLEMAIRSDTQSADLLQQVTALGLEMTALAANLSRIIPSTSPLNEAETLAASKVDIDAAHVVIKRLADLLKEYNGEATDFLAASMQSVVVVLGIDAYKRIESAVRKFDFDNALEALKKGAADAGCVLGTTGDMNRKTAKNE